jgi:hypothetical protein
MPKTQPQSFLRMLTAPPQSLVHEQWRVNTDSKRMDFFISGPSWRELPSEDSLDALNHVGQTTITTKIGTAIGASNYSSECNGWQWLADCPIRDNGCMNILKYDLSVELACGELGVVAMTTIWMFYYTIIVDFWYTVEKGGKYHFI